MSEPKAWLCEGCGDLVTGDLCTRCGRAVPARVGTRAELGNRSMSTYTVPVYANSAWSADSAVKSAVGLMLALFGVAQVLNGHMLLGVVACVIGVIVLTRRWVVTPLMRALVTRKFRG